MTDQEVDLLQDLLNRPDVMIVADLREPGFKAPYPQSERVMTLSADVGVAYTREGNENVPAVVRVDVHRRAVMTHECLQRKMRQVMEAKQGGTNASEY